MPTLMAKPRATTTVSTIAIRAGDHTKIVLAVLKSVDWVHLRIDEMHPSMLHVGAYSDEAKHLLNIHDDLMARLKAKQENIEDLLQQADRVVDEQNAVDRPVYEAMADSMSVAWRDLNKQLHLRGQLLRVANDFFASVDLHDSAARKMERELRIGQEYSTNPEMMQRWLKDMQLLRTELINATADAVEAGDRTIRQMRELGAMADNPERPRETLETCKGIEAIMLRLLDQWKSISVTWEEQSGKWQRGALAAQWRGELDTIDAWLRTHEQLVQRGDVGDGSYATERLIRQFDSIVQEATEQTELLSRCLRGIDALDDGVLDKLSWRTLGEELGRRLQDLIQHAQLRRPLLNDIAQWFKQADNTITELHSLIGEVSGVGGEGAEGYVGRGNEIIEKTVTVGQQLAHRAHPLNVRAMHDKMSEMQQLAGGIDSSASTKSREVIIEFERQFKMSMQWLVDVAEPFLRQNRDMGTSTAEVDQFVKRYESMAQEIICRDSSMQQLLSKAAQSTSAEVQRKGADFAERWQRARGVVEQRVSIAHKYALTAKCMQDCTTTIDSIETQQRSGSDMGTALASLDQSVVTCRSHVESCVTSMQAVTDVTPHGGRVRDRFGEIDGRRRGLHDGQAKKQRHDEQLTNVHKVIEEVEYWIREVTEVVADTERETKTTHSSEQSNRLMNKLQPYEQQRGQIESKIRTAEQQAEHLNCEATEHRIDQTRRSYKEIVDRLVQCKAHLTQLTHTLQGKERQAAMQPPKFTNQLQDLTVEEHGRVELRCTLVADPIAQLTWYKDGMNISHHQQYTSSYVNGTVTLTMGSASGVDDGVFTCRAVNEVGVAETHAKVTVRVQPKGHPPIISPSLRDVQVVEGDRCALETKVTGLPAPVLKWYCNGRQLQSGGEIQITTDMNGWSRLIVTKAEMGHGGEYSVEASNEHGSDRSRAHVTVVQPRPLVVEEYYESNLSHSASSTAPDFVRPFPAEYRASVGQKVRIDCMMVGNPRSKITWTFNGKPVSQANSDFCELLNEGDTYTLLINNMTMDHAGVWEMHAVNGRGEADCGTRLTVVAATEGDWRMASATPVNIGTPPHFTRTMTSVVAMEGETIGFEATVTGTITLTFSNASQRHNGKYTCEAKNCAGVATSSAQFVVRGRTSAPDFTERLISREMAEGECLRWQVKVTGDPPPSVRWLRNGDVVPNCPEVHLSQEGNGLYTLTINSVEAADAGQFTALAENGAGEARSTADLVVRAKGAPPTNFYHMTKVTEGKQVHGKEMTINEAFSLSTQSTQEQRQSIEYQ